MKRVWSVIVCFALCWVSVAQGMGRIALDADQSVYRLEQVLEQYLEVEARLTIDDVLTSTPASVFTPIKTAAVALGQTDDAVWFRANLRNAGAEPVKVNWVISYIFLEQIDFYRVHEHAVVYHQRLGKTVPYSERTVDVEPYVFPEKLSPGESFDYYFRVKSGVPMLIPFSLVDDMGFGRQMRRYHIFVGMFLGIMMGMVSYNLFLFFAMRDYTYLYYVFFMFSGCLAQLALIGVLDQFTPEWVEFNRMNGNLFSSLVLTFGVLFASKMLELETFPASVQWFMKASVVFFAVCVMGSVFNIPMIHIPLTVGVGVLSLVIWLLALYKVMKGYRPALYFFGAWTVLTIGAVTTSGLYGGLVPYNDWTVWLFPFCAGMEATLLSFSLAARINILRKQQHASDLTAQKAVTESQAKGQFLAQMSHEIRTPMNGVLGMADLLKQTALDPQQQQYLDIISNSGKALLTIINDILDFSKIAAGKMQLDEVSFDLEKLVGDSVQMFSLPAAGKGIFVKANWDDKVPALVVGDPTRIRQVLTNLLSNAFKFTEKGGVTVEVQWVEALSASGGEPDILLRIAITDTGIGISAENQALLFQAFSQAEASTTRRFGGTGLGLAICKQLAELMGGEVGIRSQVGRGSTFWFTVLVREDFSSDALVERQRQLVALRNLKLTFIEEGRVLAPLLRLLGGQEEKIRTWAQCADYNIADKPQWIVAVVEKPAQVPLCTNVIRQNAKIAPWLVFVPMGFVKEQEQALRDAGAFVVTQPVLGRAAWVSLSQAALQCAIHKKPEAELKGHVLVAEDNTVNQKVITSMLKKLGLTCEVVENGKQALERALDPRGNYSLVLMDCEMPEMDGYEATTRIRAFEKEKHVPALPIIALSAHVMSEHLQAVKNCGMNDSLSKPVNLDMLRETLGRHLAA